MHGSRPLSDSEQWLRAVAGGGPAARGPVCHAVAHCGHAPPHVRALPAQEQSRCGAPPAGAPALQPPACPSPALAGPALPCMRLHTVLGFPCMLSKASSMPAAGQLRRDGPACSTGLPMHAEQGKQHAGHDAAAKEVGLLAMLCTPVNAEHGQQHAGREAVVKRWACMQCWSSCAGSGGRPATMQPQLEETGFWCRA